jgi:hypothetical protein
MPQTPVAWAGAHAMPQPPQLATLDVMFTSQPSAATPSQSSKPITQVEAHAPPAHTGTALAPALHVVAQVPQ